MLDGARRLRRQLPIFGNDIDFGWRAAAAGHRTLIVPQAVVFHAEAAHRGVRRTPITGRHTHYQERRAALYTLLANSRARSLPFQLLRLGLGTLLRMVGLLLVRQVGQALDELAALVSLYSSPREILAARRDRAARSADRVDRTTCGALLAPRWVPYRHGLDFVSDLLAAATNQAADVAERRRAAKAEVVPTAPDRRRGRVRPRHGPGRPVLHQPGGASGSPCSCVLALVGAREAFGIGRGRCAVAGARRRPVTGGSLHVSSWHPIGQGTDVPAPAYVLPLAALATLLLGSPGAAILPAGAGRAALASGAPGGSCAWSAGWWTRSGFPTLLLGVGRGDLRPGPGRQRRLGPGPARRRRGGRPAALAGPRRARFRRPRADRRWRAAWRSALLLRSRGGLRAGRVLVLPRARARGRRGRVRDQPALDARPLGLGSARGRAWRWCPSLLAPWWLPALLSGAGEAFVLDAGRVPMSDLGFRELVVAASAAGRRRARGPGRRRSAARAATTAPAAARAGQRDRRRPPDRAVAHRARADPEAGATTTSASTRENQKASGAKAAASAAAPAPRGAPATVGLGVGEAERGMGQPRQQRRSATTPSRP